MHDFGVHLKPTESASLGVRSGDVNVDKFSKCPFRSSPGSDPFHVLGETLTSVWLKDTVHNLCFCFDLYILVQSVDLVSGLQDDAVPTFSSFWSPECPPMESLWSIFGCSYFCTGLLCSLS